MARLAAQEGVDLLLMDAGDEPLGGAAATVLERAPCDVALVLPGSGPAGDGPVFVPSAERHDWAALELGAWLARTMGAPLRSSARADAAGRGATRAGSSPTPP